MAKPYGSVTTTPEEEERKRREQQAKLQQLRATEDKAWQDYVYKQTQAPSMNLTPVTNLPRTGDRYGLKSWDKTVQQPNMAPYGQGAPYAKPENIRYNAAKSYLGRDVGTKGLTLDQYNSLQRSGQTSPQDLAYYDYIWGRKPSKYEKGFEYWKDAGASHDVAVGMADYDQTVRQLGGIGRENALAALQSGHGRAVSTDDLKYIKDSLQGWNEQNDPAQQAMALVDDVKNDKRTEEELIDYVRNTMYEGQELPEGMAEGIARQLITSENPEQVLRGYDAGQNAWGSAMRNYNTNTAWSGKIDELLNERERTEGLFSGERRDYNKDLGRASQEDRDLDARIKDFYDKDYEDEDYFDSGEGQAAWSKLSEDIRKKYFDGNPDVEDIEIYNKMRELGEPMGAYNEIQAMRGDPNALYHYVNDREYARKYEGLEDWVNTNETVSDWYNNGYFLLTPAEKDEFNYRYENDMKNGTSTAQEFLTAMEPTLRSRKSEDFKQQMASYAETSPIEAALTSIGANLTNGILAPLDVLGVLTGRIKPDDVAFDKYNAVQAIRQTQAQNLDDWLVNKWNWQPGVGSFFLNAFYSAIDSSAGALTGQGMGEALGAAVNGTKLLSDMGETFGLLIMSGNATANDLNANLSAGMSAPEAIGRAIASGAIEYATEKIGWDRIFSTDGGLLMSGLTEALEEGIGSVANLATGEISSLIFQHEGDIARRFDEWRMEHPDASTEEIHAAVLGSVAAETGMDMLAGFVSGEMMAAPVQSMVYSKNRTTGGNVIANGETIAPAQESTGTKAKPARAPQGTINEVAVQDNSTGAKQNVSPEATTPQATPPQRPRRQKAATPSVASNSNVKTLMDLAEGFDSDTNAAQQAQKIKDKLTKGKNVSKADVGKLWSAVAMELDEQGQRVVRDTMTEGVRERLNELGETPGEINAVADIIGKAASGTELSRSEMKRLAASKYGTRVFNEYRFDDTDGYATTENARRTRDRSEEANLINWVRRAQVQSMAAPAKKAKAKTAANPKGTLSERAKMDELATGRAKAEQTVAAEQTARALHKKGSQASAESRKVEFSETAKDSGETYTAYGEITKITDVAKDGTVTVEVKGMDGSTRKTAVDPTEIKVAGSGVSQLLAEIETSGQLYSAEQANGLLQTYKGGDVKEHIKAFNEAYKQGWQNYDAASDATDTQRIANDLGKQYKRQMIDQRNKAQAAAKSATKGKGSITIQTEGENAVTTYANLDEIMTKGQEGQRSAVDMLGVLADKLGLDIVLYESHADSEGNYTAANGYHSGNEIGIDLNAGRDSSTSTADYMLLTVAGHELTHHIENRVGAEAYEALVSLARKEVERTGGDWDKALDRYVSQAWNGKKLTLDEARSELVADTMSDMLRNEAKLRDLLNDAGKENPTLRERIVEFLRNLADTLRKAFAGDRGLSTESTRILQAGGYTSETVDMWYRLLEEASQIEADTKFAEAVKDAKAHPVKEFHARNAVEYRDDNLIAVHNVRARNLAKMMDTGSMFGLSVAVMQGKNADANSGYGEISLVFDADAIDPEKNEGNHVFGSDAYTPRSSGVIVGYMPESYPALGSLTDRVEKAMQAAEKTAGRELYNERRGSEFIYIPGESEWVFSASDIKRMTRVSSLMSDAGIRELYRYETGKDPASSSEDYRGFCEKISSEFTNLPEPMIAGSTGEMMPYTPENMVKELRNWPLRGERTEARAAREYKSVQEIQDDRSRITSDNNRRRKMIDAEDRLNKAISAAVYELVDRRYAYDLKETIAEHIAEGRDAIWQAVMDSEDRRESWPKTKEELDAALDRAGVDAALADLQSIPAEYAEAKLMRVVPFSEIAMAVVPDTEKNIGERLTNEFGVPVRYYATEAQALDILQHDTVGMQFSARNTAYMEAVENGDTYQAQKLVNEAAVEAGAFTDDKGNPIDLYHGTTKFGFTVFDLARTKYGIGALFTTSSETVAHGYGGFTRTKQITEAYVPDDGTDATLIKNAKNILNASVERLTQAKADQIRNVEIQKYKELAEAENKAMQESPDYVPPEEIDGAFWEVAQVFNDVISEDRYLFDKDEAWRDEYRQRGDNWVKDRNKIEARDRVKEYFNEHGDERQRLKTEGKGYYKLLYGYEHGDGIIDLEYKYKPLLDSGNDFVWSNTDTVTSRAKLQQSIESAKGEGTYKLYGIAGDNPLTVDAKKAFWTNIEAPMIGEGVYSTDYIAKWAKENGYTSVVIKNVMDPGQANAYGDDYIFFNSEQLKSADPVTYDKNNKPIPLDERFKKSNKDIRYSARSAFRSDLNKTEAEAFDNLDETSQDIVASLGKGTKIQSRDGEMELAVSRDKHTIAYSARTWRDGGEDLLRKALGDNGHTEAEIDDTVKWINEALDYLETLGTEMSENRAFTDEQGNYEQYRGAYTGESGYNNLSQHLAANITTYVKEGKTPRQVLSTLVSNGDYPVNLDVTLICKKRVAYSQLLQRLINDGVFDNVNFGGAAIATVNDILKNHGFETACLGCFVESRRLKIQEWAETIVEEWNAEVDKRTKNAGSFDFAKGGKQFTKEERAALVMEFEQAGKLNPQGNHNLGQGSVRQKMGKLLDMEKSLRQHLTVADLLTPQGMNMLRSYDQDLFSLVRLRYGTNSPKITQEFYPYSGEVAKMTYNFVKAVTGNAVPGKKSYMKLAKQAVGAWNKKSGETKAEYNARVETEAMRQYLYDIGGARTQSFSDFMIENVFDYIQMFADLAARNFPLHGYTKEIVCLRLFGMTGAKWNGSLISHVDGLPANASAEEIERIKSNAGLLPVEEAKHGRGLVVEYDGKKYAICFDDYARNKATKGKSFIQSIGLKDIIALQLDPRYSANVGSITIGVSDKHILAMLDSDLFRMVIPYHASGMMPIYAQLIGADAYNDYTLYQKTTVRQYYDLDGNPVEGLYAPGEKKPLLPDMSYDYNAELQRIAASENISDREDAARKAASNYVEWCTKDYKKHPVYDGKKLVGYATLAPKFSSSPYGTDFTKHPNYYKLLEDFNVYDNLTGKDAVQGAVTMTFPSGANALSGPQLEAYKDALRQVGRENGDEYALFTEAEIEKYAKKATMSFKDIIASEIHNRALYETTQSEQWEPAVKAVKKALKTGVKIGNTEYNFNSTPEERSKARASKNVQASARNTEYMAAVETNDMETAQRLVDEAAKEAGYDTPKLYHGTPSFGFTQLKGIVFATDSKETAGTYSGTSEARRISDATGSTLGMYQFYGNTEGMLALDANGAETNHIALGQHENAFNRSQEFKSWRSFATINQIIKYAKENGYTGVVVKNVNDSATPQSRQTLKPATDYVFFDPKSQLKSADPVTYDKNNKPIPLDERFNTEEPDIRYSSRQQLPGANLSVWDYLADDTQVTGNTEAEEKALTVFRDRVQRYRAAAQRVTELEQQTQALTGDELKTAKRELGQARAEATRLLNAVYQAEQTEAMQAVEKANRKTVQMIREAAENNQLQSLVEKTESKYIAELARQRARYENKMREERQLQDIRKEIGRGKNIIEKNIKKVDHLIRHETDYQNVPEDYKPLAETLVRLIAGSDENGGSLVFNGKEAHKLLEAYERIALVDGTETGMYDADIMATLQELSDAIDERGQLLAATGLKRMDKALYEMNLIQRIAETVQGLSNAINYSRLAFVNGQRVKIQDAADPMLQSLAAHKNYGELQGALGRAAAAADKMMRLNNMTMPYFDRYVNNPGFSSLVQNMFGGESTLGLRLGEAKKFEETTVSDYHYKDWGFDKNKLEFKTKGGRNVSLTREQAMALYAISKREAQTGMNSHHLDQGGFVLPTESTDQAKIFGREKADALEARTNPVQITEEDMDVVKDWLTDEQKAYADEMVRFLSEEMAEYGNETSMALFGIKKYKEKYYYPFQSYSGNLYQRSDAGSTSTTSDARLKHMSFTKALTKNANTPIVLTDFTQTVMNHVQQMITYSSMVVPIETFNRVMNYKFDTGNGQQRTVRTEFERKYGQRALGYVSDYIKDLNGGVKAENRAGLDKFISLMKKGGVAASLSVALQQPWSIIRAGYVMSHADLLWAGGGGAGWAIKGAKAFEEAKQYAGTANIKEMGRFDTGVGYTATEWLTPKKEIGIGKLKVNASVMGAIDQITGWAPEEMDKLTWGTMWRAVKHEQARLHKDMDPNSEEFLQMCGRRFDEVMRLTQVYDSTVVRSGLMRSNNSLDKMVSAFAGEPTITANMLMDAFKRHPKKIGNAVAIFILSQLGQAVIKGLMSTIRGKDDDEDERNLLEKMSGKVATQMIDELNPLNLLPIVRDITDVVNGNEIDRSDMSIFNDLYKEGEKIAKTIAAGGIGQEGAAYKNWYQAIENSVGTIAKVLGVPVKNLMRDTRAVLNLINDVGRNAQLNKNNVRLGWLDGSDTAWWTGWWDKSRKAYYTRITDALLSGEKDDAEMYNTYLTSIGVKPDTLKTGVKTEIKDRWMAKKLTDKQAVDLLVKNEYSKNEKEAWTYLGKAADKAAADDAGRSASVYGSVLDAVHKGDWTAAESEIRTLGSHDIDRDTVVTRIRTDTKDRYINGEISYDQAAALLKRYSSNEKETDDDRYWKLRDWDDEKANGKDSDWSKYSDLDAALDSGDENAILKAMQELASHGVKQSTLKSALTKWKKMREDAGITINGAVLMAYNKARKSYVNKVY